MSGGGEVFAGDFGEESGCGPDADSGHARQDGLKRVRIDQLVDLRCDLVGLLPQGCELRCESSENQGGRVGAGYRDGLFAERGDDLVCPVSSSAGREFQHPCSDPLLTRGAQISRRGRRRIRRASKVSLPARPSP